MRSRDTDNLTRQELRTLQRVLRTRASNLKKNVKRYGLIRPLSQIDTDLGLVKVQSSVKVLRNGETIAVPLSFLFDPQGYFCSVWNICAVFQIVALVFYLPLLAAFFNEPSKCNYFQIAVGPPHTSAGVPGHPLLRGWQYFPVFTNYFFLVDIFVHCLTAVKVSPSTKDYGLQTIWSRYLKSWFLVDAIACIPLDCILFAAAPRANLYNIPKFIRLLRVASIWRRSQGNPFRILDKVSDLRQEFSFSARRIAMAAFAEMVAVHWFACILWWTIRLQAYPHNTWPSLLGLVNVGVPEQYLWSLFTLVSAAVQNTWGPYNPTTWGEALVWTIGMVLVAVLFAVIVGFITAAIRSSIQTKAKYKDMMDTVVDSLDEHEIPEEMRHRIMSFYRHKYEGGQYWHQESILRELPYDMQVEAALHSADALLSKVSIIGEEPTLKEKVALMLQPAYILKGGCILRQGKLGRSMYFVRSGFVDLVMDGAVVDTIPPGGYFGEVALLTLPSKDELLKVCGDRAETISSHAERFPSVFDARALTNCSLFALDAVDFHEAADQYPGVESKLQAWAIRHAKQLVKYQAEVEEVAPASSFSLPPDTPVASQTTSFTHQDSNISTDAHSLPTSPHLRSGVSATMIRTPVRLPVSGRHTTLENQLSVHSMASQSTSVPTLVRLLSPRRKSFSHRPGPLLRQPLSDGTKPRVMADSATILNFAELRSSIEAADQRDADVD
ncbi:Potassium/sodium hyperpolarization-activated cyclic nucleotide-gated channel 3 [Trebouxia sp. C0009 RCD-2024]